MWPISDQLTAILVALLLPKGGGFFSLDGRRRKKVCDVKVVLPPQAMGGWKFSFRRKIQRFLHSLTTAYRLGGKGWFRILELKRVTMLKKLNDGRLSARDMLTA